MKHKNYRIKQKNKALLIFAIDFIFIFIFALLFTCLYVYFNDIISFLSDIIESQIYLNY